MLAQINTNLPAPDPDFKWITKYGERLSPKEMSTGHVFYSLRMLWNHTVPQEKRLRPYKEYAFRNPNEEYWRKAVLNLLYELSTRDDVAQFMIDDLVSMARHLKLLEAPK